MMGRDPNLEPRAMHLWLNLKRGKINPNPPVPNFALLEVVLPCVPLSNFVSRRIRISSSIPRHNMGDAGLATEITAVLVVLPSNFSECQKVRWPDGDVIPAVGTVGMHEATSTLRVD